nr:glycop C [Kampung Karu virus]
YKACASAFTFSRAPADTGHGTVVFEVTSSSEAPCRVVTNFLDASDKKLEGRIITVNPILLEADGKVAIEVEAPFGNSILEVEGGTPPLHYAWHR